MGLDVLLHVLRRMQTPTRNLLEGVHAEQLVQLFRHARWRKPQTSSSSSGHSEGLHGARSVVSKIPDQYVDFINHYIPDTQRLSF